MIEIYMTSAAEVHGRLNGILSRRLDSPFEIVYTESGKPYIKGNPVFFSISHSGERAVIALSDAHVGADLEIFTGRERKSVVSRWSQREQAEIFTETDFLKHWTAREAYVKLYGLKIAGMWRRLEFFGGNLYADGKMESLKPRFYIFNYGVAAVFSES